ncbi:hypothetical protein XELAEV_18012294mg, partial [Xenopus laevis]
MSTWQCLADSIKEGKGSYDDTVDELIKVLHPFDIGLMAAYKTKQKQNENPLIFANKLWAAYHIGKGRTGNRDDSEYKNLLICNAHPKIRGKCGFLIDPRTQAYNEIIVLMQQCFNVLQKHKPFRPGNSNANNLDVTVFHAKPCISSINKENGHYNNNTFQSKVTNVHSAQRQTSKRSMQTAPKCNAYQTMVVKINALENGLKTEHRRNTLRELELHTKIDSLKNKVTSLQTQNNDFQQATHILQLSHKDAVVKYDLCHTEMVKCKKDLNDLQEKYTKIVPLNAVKSTQTEHMGNNYKVATVSSTADKFEKHAP